MNLQIPIDKEVLKNFCIKNNIKKLSLFGSSLEKGFENANDIDLLVEFYEEKVPGYFGICHMENELIDLLNGKKVDLRTAEELSRYFRNEVVSEAIVQYESK